MIDEIVRTGLVRDEAGHEYLLQDCGIDRFEGELLTTLIRSDQNIRKTLEVGCAFGISSLYICSALSTRDAVKHVIIDPAESTYWHGVGISNLRRAGFGSFFELIEKPSELVLPVLAEKEAGTYDLVFIDGIHTLDHALLDCFYANRLIRIGGYVVMDDCNLPSIAKVVSYLTQYPCYRLLSHLSRGLHRKSLADGIAGITPSLLPPHIAGYLLPKSIYDRYYIRTVYPSMVVLQKVEEDNRGGSWFRSF